ncbi:hypothetical protein L873DRAFT_1794347 [Choiromyces venosus 120613-1]|uniref:Uncharacterized protein n=1 Tax=Choiromyces venosus 120613-1 TaxID=1336337 RepID=A0A3N4J5A2_9PEZI|nr:hypothetical protein L873DRAFT_1794347 [Choiromyces venosus 120613-1]
MTDAPRQLHCPPANSAFDTRTGGLALCDQYNAVCALLRDKNASPSPHTERVGPSHVSNISHPRSSPGFPSNSHEPEPRTISDQCASAFESPLPPPLLSPIRLHAITLLDELSSMICGAEDYTWALFDLVPSGRTEGYSVSWESGELLWAVKVCVTLFTSPKTPIGVRGFGYPPIPEDLVSG